MPRSQYSFDLIIKRVKDSFNIDLIKECKINESRLWYDLINLSQSNKALFWRSIGSYVGAFRIFKSLGMDANEINDLISKSRVEMLYNFDATKLSNFKVLKKIATANNIDESKLAQNIASSPDALSIDLNNMKAYLTLFHKIDLDNDLVEKDLKQLNYFKRFLPSTLYSFIEYLINDTEYTHTFDNLKNVTKLSDEERHKIIKTYPLNNKEDILKRMIGEYFKEIEDKLKENSKQRVKKYRGE